MTRKRLVPAALSTDPLLCIGNGPPRRAHQPGWRAKVVRLVKSRCARPHVGRERSLHWTAQSARPVSRCLDLSTENGTMNRNEVLSIRVDGSNPRHHIWNNHGVWWIHYTVLVGGVRQRRMRYSLGTRDEQEAARLRDRIFQGLGREPVGEARGEAALSRRQLAESREVLEAGREVA